MDVVIDNQMEPDHHTVPSPHCSAIFDNPLLLSKIFSHVDTAKDLKSIRQVSTSWRDESLNQWRKIGTVKLLWKAVRPSYCDSCWANQYPDQEYYGETMKLQEFLELWERSGQDGDSCPYQLQKKPFARFRIGFCSFLLQSQLIDENLEKFWSTCGAHITYLNLDHVSIDGTKCFDSFREMLADRLPNLKELAVRAVPDRKNFMPEDLKTVENFPSPWVQDHSGKLERLTLGFCRNSREVVRNFNEHVANWLFHFYNLQNLKLDSTACNFLHVLHNPTRNGQLVKLRELTFPSQVGSDFNSFKVLGEYVKAAQPPLKIVRIGADLLDLCLQSSLRDFLINCQGTLEHLELGSHPTAIKDSCSLSDYLRDLSLPHVTKLYLFGESVFNFRALREMPNLKTLWIQSDNCIYDWNQKVEKEEKRDATKGKLLWKEINNFHLDYYRFTSNSLKVLGKWMPNLKMIQVFLNKSTGELVKEIWPGVEVVTVVRGGLVGF